MYVSITASSAASIGTFRSLPPLPFTLITAEPSSSVRHVPHVDQSEFFRPQSSEKCSENESEIPFLPVCSARIGFLRDSREQRFHRGPGERLRQRLLQLRAPNELHRVGRQQFVGIEEGAQHIPRGPAAPDRCSFVFGGEGRECCTHRIACYVSRSESDRFTVCDEFGDGGEVLSIGLHRVRRGFTGLPVVQELLERLGDLSRSPSRSRPGARLRWRSNGHRSRRTLHQAPR